MSDDDVMIGLYRRMTCAEKVGMLNVLWREGRELLAKLARLDHPDWNKEQIEQEVSRQMMRLHELDDVELIRKDRSPG